MSRPITARDSRYLWVTADRKFTNFRDSQVGGALFQLVSLTELVTLVNRKKRNLPCCSGVPASNWGDEVPNKFSLLALRSSSRLNLQHSLCCECRFSMLRESCDPFVSSSSSGARAISLQAEVRKEASLWWNWRSFLPLSG